jgi:hypothetical protein
VPGGPAGKPMQSSRQAVEFISEVTDGTTITTTSAPAGKLLDSPPGVVRNHLPGYPLGAMLPSHQKTVGDYLERHPGVSLEKIETFRDAVAAWQKGIDRQRERLQAGGGLNRQEFMRISGPGKAEIAREVYDQMEKEKKK